MVTGSKTFVEIHLHIPTLFQIRLEKEIMHGKETQMKLFPELSTINYVLK